MLLILILVHKLLDLNHTHPIECNYLKIKIYFYQEKFELYRISNKITHNG